MQVLDSLDSFTTLRNTAVTLGNFDGIHLAHQKILKTLVETARKNKAKSVVLTFANHPRTFFQPHKRISLLNTPAEKYRNIAVLGVDYLVSINFDKKFSQITASDFITKILIEKLGTQFFIIGYNHHFGKNKAGNYNFLKQNPSICSFNFQQIEVQKLNQEIINSSLIRAKLKAGEIEVANQLLGSPYQLTGKVIKGRGMGRKIDYPTANLIVNHPQKLLPQMGTYAVKVLYQKQYYKGMLNLGIRPTLEENNLAVEVNIFDFFGDLYGQELTILFFKKLRNEIKFNSLDELKKQLTKDKMQALKAL